MKSFHIPVRTVPQSPRKPVSVLFGLSFFVFLFFGPLPDASAIFSLSVRPYEGGNDLRFDRVSEAGPYGGKAVMVSVQSDIARQYQIIQTLLDPLTSDEGASLPQENFIVYGSLGSNAMGTLGVQQESSVTVGRTILYTSSLQGEQDSFQVVYVVKNVSQAAAGSYHGRIAYTLEPIGGAEQPQTVILHVYAEIEKKAAVDVKTESGSGVIRLSAARDETKSDRLFFSVSGKMSGLMRITQALPEPLRSSEGETLPEGALLVGVADAANGDIPAQPFSLSARQEVLYTSSGGGDDRFTVVYSLGALEKQRAGLYRGRIALTSEISGKEEPLEGVNLEVEIPRRFDLVVTPKLGGMIEFHNLKVQEGPQQSEVTIEISSNIARPYQVTQKLFSPLVDREGRMLAPACFTLKEESQETGGRILFPESVVVREGDMTLFVSDSEGSSAKFAVIYELTPSAEATAGDYTAQMVYQISEM